MKILYVRCSGGDYFRLRHVDGHGVNACPFDGWAVAELPHVATLVETLGPALSLDAIKAAGVSAELLSRLLVIEFGGPESEFEAISPGHVAIDGRIFEAAEMPLRLL